MPNQSIAIQTDIDLEQLRARLRKMTDAELIRFGKAAAIRMPSWLEGRTAERMLCDPA